MSELDCCLPGSTTETCERDNLIGDCTVRTQPFTLQAGTYAKGDVLFQTGVGSQLVNFATDPGGSTDENAIAIMPFTTTLSENDEVAVYVGGEFNEDAIIGYTDLDVLKLTFTGEIRLRKFY
jgi:hypothetical protein